MAAEGPNREQVYTLRGVLAALFRQSRTLTVCFAVLITCVVGALLFVPDVYESELKILVKRDRVDSLVSAIPGSERTGSSEVSEAELLTEVELLQGDDLLEQVVLSVGLPSENEPQEASSVEGSGGRSRSIADAVKAVRGDLRIEPIKKTWMIDVTYASRDPQRAKRVLDVLSDLYLQKHLAVRRPPGAYEFFSEQADTSLQALEEAQMQLQAFGERNHVVSASAEKEMVLQKLAEFESMQQEAEATLAETTQHVAALESERERTPAKRTSEQRTSDPAGLMQDVQSRMLTLELKRTELLQKFTPRYRAVVQIDQQLEQARAALERARSAAVKEETIADNPTMQWLENEIARARTEREALGARVKALGATVNAYRTKAQDLDAKGATQQTLLRALNVAEEEYLLYQRKQEEARISDALDRTRIANVAVAQAPTVPAEARPTRRLLWLALGACAALVLSLAVALMKDAASPVVRTPEELGATLENVPVLAWIPASEQ
ncbi:MAG: hypothetical protein GEV06_11435 [Luteitalea sp.]|nr:hypothetical protein [Luteitalea sp.]